MDNKQLDDLYKTGLDISHAEGLRKVWDAGHAAAYDAAVAQTNTDNQQSMQAAVDSMGPAS